MGEHKTDGAMSIILPQCKDTPTSPGRDREESEDRTLDRRKVEVVKSEREEDKLTSIMLKVVHINELRQELIRKTYRFPHNTRYWASALMGLYILSLLAVVVYVGTMFATPSVSEPVSASLAMYASCDDAMLTPLEAQLNSQVSQHYADDGAAASDSTQTNVSNSTHLTSMLLQSQSHSVSSSMRWTVSVLLSLALYAFVWAPVLLLTASALMLYNVHRARTFDINCANICGGLLLRDVLCLRGRCCKGGCDGVTVSADSKKVKFHGVSQDDEDDDDHAGKVSVEMNDVSGHTPRKVLNSFSLSAMSDNKGSAPQKVLSEYAFLCNDGIFVSPSKEEERKLDALVLKPSSMQKQMSLQRGQKRSKKRRRKQKRRQK